MNTTLANFNCICEHKKKKTLPIASKEILPFQKKLPPPQESFEMSPVNAVWQKILTYPDFKVDFLICRFYNAFIENSALKWRVCKFTIERMRPGSTRQAGRPTKKTY